MLARKDTDHTIQTQRASLSLLETGLNQTHRIPRALTPDPNVDSDPYLAEVTEKDLKQSSHLENVMDTARPDRCRESHLMREGRSRRDLALPASAFPGVTPA